MAEREEFIIPEELLGEDEIILVDMVVEAVEQTVEMEVLGDDNEVDMVIVPDERILDMEVDDYVAGGGTPGGGILVETDPTVPAWAKQPTKPHYTASEVGADALGSANEALELAMSYTNQKVGSIEIPTKLSELSDDVGFLKEHQSLDGYATEDWVEQQGYLTEHQSLEGYATEQWVEGKHYLTEHQSLEGYAKAEDIPTELPASDVYAWAKQPNKPTYTYSEVGADKSGSADGALDNAKKYTDQKIASIPTPDVSGQINTHNTNTSAHNDIRLVIQTLTTKVNDLLDSDDETLDQMSEVVAYIKANRELLESVTINKVNVADIIDNLETNVSDRPLSAAQGVALKALIDAIKVPTKVSELANDAEYLTEHQSLEGYATEEWVEEQSYLKEHQSLDGYATEQWVEGKNYLTEHQDLSGYATEEFVQEKIEEIEVVSGKDGYTPQKGVDYFTDVDKQEMKNLLFESVYPVGAIYISTVATNPKTLFGFGTWEQIQDRFLLASGGTYSAGTTGGSATHTLTIDEIPTHNHSMSRWNGRLPNEYSSTQKHVYTPEDSGASGTTSNTGGGQAHNNMPPYLAVYMWKRIA